ncbi:hypothetical protein ZWY2020_033315 [Hordeum vulgare]|nr:hypothetical protein ZWY2020_033315 [Hordeum vulgare]
MNGGGTMEESRVRQVSLEQHWSTRMGLRGSEDSQNNFSEPSADMDSGTSLERRPSDQGTPTSHGMPKAATRSRRKINSDEEDVDFIPEECVPQKQKEKTTVRKTMRKEYARPADIKALKSRLAKKPRMKRSRNRIFHVVGRETSMYEDPAEVSGDEEEEIPAEVPPPKMKNLMVDVMPKKTAPKPSAPKDKKSIAPKRTTKDNPAAEKNKGSASREFAAEE